jgi:hypothetical protein
VEEAPKITLDVSDIVSSSAVVEPETTEEASSAPETNEDVQTSEEEPTEGNETDGEDESEAATEDEVSADETQTDEPKPRSAQARIRDLVTETRELKNTITELTSKTYKAPSADDVLAAAEERGEDMSIAEARVGALEQRDRIRDYTAHVTEVNTTLTSEAREVMREFPIFNPESKDYSPELDRLAEQAYLKVANIQTDPYTGLISDVAATPYQIYETIAQAFSAGSATTQVKAQKSAEKMLASADTPTSAAPTPKKETSFLKGFDPKYRRDA